VIKMSKEDGLLTDEQAINPKGCGVGTENACFAVTHGPKGFECMFITNRELAQIAGEKLNWRVNVDKTDDDIRWCPLDILNYSKKE
jgi:hypothetical protein